ncbi:MAG TPA: FGGY-family carbohydrate kinase, partial [Actinomycetota bacterium]|nr:FGGY-family carbohydrate kinase [Actinomycetota bacterium]
NKLGERAGNVTALSVCATSATVLALDSSGRPLGPAITYADQRAAGEAARAQAAVPEIWTALGLTIAPSFGLPKWAWLLANRPPAKQPSARLGHASDAVVAALTGALPPADTSHALKSGYDPANKRWVSEAMDALGIPVALLPEVLLPGSPAGRLTREASEVTGLPAGCEVRLGMTDSCAAQLAAGAAAPGRFVSVLGSTLVLKGATLGLLADPQGAVYSHLHPGGWWLPGGASSTGGRALAAGFAGDSLRELDGQAAARGPAGCVVYPLLGRGERFPFAAPAAEGFTLGEPADPVELYRATLEGVAFVERLGYARLRELGAEPAGPLVTAGGGSASRVWNRIRATVLGTELEAKPGASTALGACILAAAGTLHPDVQSATEAMAASGSVVEPDPEESGRMDASYRRFVEEVFRRGWIANRR